MRVLVVDDEKNIRESVARFLALDGIVVIQAGDGVTGKKALEESAFDAAIIDLKMPVMNGLELLQWINECGPDIPVIMISAFGEIKDAVNAMKLGAKDYLVKPFDPEELLIKLKRVFNEKLLESKVANAESGNKDFSLTGVSQSIKEINGLIKKVAKVSSNILITGESGTGKEVAARMIHEMSDRVRKPFVPVNIGGVPENLLESELFGYEKGAFTGAVDRKVGLFETASGGTLFLDEIGEMPVHLQVKLLRVLQERKIQRLGSNTLIPVDIRLVAATNRDLETEIKNGNFREDLYYRLNVVRLHLPPLRQRREDIPELASIFIKKFNERFGKTVKSLTSDCVNKLIAYDYPGNIRELENIIERSFIFIQDNFIRSSDIALPERNSEVGIVQNSSGDVVGGTVKDAERNTIIAALSKSDGNRTKASLELGISRRTLINKIRDYDLKL